MQFHSARYVVHWFTAAQEVMGGVVRRWTQQLMTWRPLSEVGPTLCSARLFDTQTAVCSNGSVQSVCIRGLAIQRFHVA